MQATAENCPSRRIDAIVCGMETRLNRCWFSPIVCCGLVLALCLMMASGCMRSRVEVVGLADCPIDTADAPPNFWDPIPVSPSTTVPERIADEYWHGQFERVNQSIATTDDCQIVFFGDSITAAWTLLNQVGLPVWQERYAAMNPINMGNSGDITPVMLYRVTHGNLDFPEDAQPRVAVLLCGTNNYVVTASDGGNVQWQLGMDTPPEDVASGARAIAQEFRRRLPHTRVILLGILPVRQQAKWALCQQTNAINAMLAYNEDEVVYLDLADRFTQEDGSQIAELFTDGTHLTEAGYNVWADAIDPMIERMMDAGPLEPTKIMLIGDAVTEGADSASCYRLYLDGMLRRQGLLFDFVGSQRSEVSGVSGPGSYGFDPDHEGYRGADSATIAENLADVLPDHVPDIAVVQAGTSDIRWNSVHSDLHTDALIGNIDRMVMALRNENAHVGIVLTQILPIPGREGAVAQLNRAVLAYAGSNTTAASPIVVADLYTGFDAESGLSLDGYLPSPAGAEQMARVYSVAIQRLLAEQE